MLVRSTVSAREACAENDQTIGFRKFIFWSLEDMLFGSTVPPFQRCHLVGIQGSLALVIVIWAALETSQVFKAGLHPFGSDVFVGNFHESNLV